jgi:hypothetical protein
MDVRRLVSHVWQAKSIFFNADFERLCFRSPLLRSLRQFLATHSHLNNGVDPQ